MRRNGDRRAALASSIEQLAARAGVLTSYVDGLGEIVRPPTEVVHALCEIVTRGIGDASPPPIVVIAGKREIQFPIPGEVRGHCKLRLVLEDGADVAISRVASVRNTRQFRVHLRESLPVGVHRLQIEHRRQITTHLVLARPPSLRRVAEHAGRRLAVFLPLYSAVPGGPFGAGTYTDLRAICDWAGRTAGALVGTLPLFPAFLDHPFDPSPYAPISRLMWNELFIDPRESPEWRSANVQKSAAAHASGARARRMGKGSLVDYRKSWQLARRTLKQMAAEARSSPSRWAEVLSHASAEMQRYALFRAAADATGTGWDRWPSSWRAGRIELARVDPLDIDMYLYAQTLAAAQINAIQRASPSNNPLYLDLPVGVHASGFDTFSRPDLFLHEMSAGAPPDPLNARGQVWGFPPMHPTAGRADGYAHLRAVLRRMLSVTGVLRIDHVMGLYRMFCVPKGQDGTRGAYLRYPEEELFAIVLIEAARAGAMIVGEDLGTVPPAIRKIMKRDGVLGMHIQQFALSAGPGPSIGAANSHVLAGLNTHDTPTFAGFWHADDARLRRSLGHTDKASAAIEREGRQKTRVAVAKQLMKLKLPARNARQAGMSLMRLQARGPAPIIIVNLEDLWGERLPQNVPGTSAEYPNWRRRAAKPLRSIFADAGIAKSLSTLRKDRRQRASKGHP
ncbi:MAG: 4-alpha-glucanotransferase [Phycisphaeraceae bacterium]|nr:4-alpha-glucanotransferase [Phycisphaeraceae bacterium]